MKLQRPLVALALLVGALGRALGPNKRAAHLHQRSAALLHVNQTAIVSLDATTDKLQGVLDAVTKSIGLVVAGYTAVKDACGAETSASATRVQGQNIWIADLATTRQLSLERTAGLEATLANLVTQEEESHASYESSVKQRADALQKHLTTNTANVEQAKAITGVLDMMNMKKAQIAAAQSASAANATNANVPVSPTASASGLDYIIGVLTNIKDTSEGKATEGAADHNEADADLEKLVTSYKTSLQHIDKQYQTENARRMTAKVTARDSGEEKTLRNMLVDGEEKLDAEYITLCGADGKGGSLHGASEAADFFLSQFKQQSQNAITIMDGLPDVETAAASLLAVKRQTTQLRGHALPAPAVQHASSDTQESAARWVIEQAAKFKDHASQKLAKVVSAKFPKGVPAKKAHPVRVLVPDQQLHMLVGSSAKTATTVKATNATADAETAAIVACVEEKQTLTDEIIAARRAARVARTDKMSAEARVTAVKHFRTVVEAQKTVLTDAETNTVAGWKSLRDLIAAKSFTTDLGDAVTEMSSIETEVETYINSGGPPAASGLPAALKGIGETLTKVKERIENDMTALDSVYTGSFMISFPALINQLVNKDSDFGIEESAMADAVTISADEATKQEKLETTLMLTRSGVDYRCLSAGHCANFAYQQCCSSGTGSFMIKANSWKECTEHCEKQIAEGHQITGCELTALYKKDDITGSGTCYAQTACTLQASTTECAGSLCKAHAATST